MSWGIAAGVAVAALAGAFFAMAELAILSTSRLRLRRWVRRALEGEGWARPEDVVDRPHRLLGPLLVGRTLATVTAAVLAARLAAARGEGILATAALTAVLLTVGLYLLETAAGAVARARADVLLPVVGPALRACAWLFRPFVALADAATSPLLSWRRGRHGEEAGMRALEDLLDDSERAGIVETQEREIIAGVFAFGRTPVEQVMRPLDATETAPAGARARDIAEIVLRTGAPRVAIHGRDRRRIVGMVHLFDLFQLGPQERPHPRRVVTTSPETPCDELLVEMRRRRTHLAVVADESSALGTVSMEDLVQILTGEVRRGEHGRGPGRR